MPSSKVTAQHSAPSPGGSHRIMQAVEPSSVQSGVNMQTFQEDIDEFREQLRTGKLQKAYRALLEYMMDLRTSFKSRYPSYSISGLYQGYMDMTYFAIVPSSLKDRDLKIAIVFNYEAFRFEAWLSGTNRQIQRKYWELFKDGQWNEYRVVTPAKGVDSIIECNLAEDFDLGNLCNLTARIEENTAEFINIVEKFLSEHEPM
jgi:hypothetical protein